ncbi:MAG: hypothetical protein AB1814_15840 [Thermodesulfobacteriota bacterium]
MGRRKTSPPITLRGVVIPLAWSEAGEVIAVGIATFNEQEFLLAPQPSLATWLGLLRQEVELVGGVAVNEQGVKVLRVDSFHVIGKEERHEEVGL